MSSIELLEKSKELIQQARNEASILHPYAAQFDLLAKEIEQHLNEATKK